MIVGASVADVMRAQVVAVREEARCAEIVGAMRRYRVSSLPVIDSGGRVIGQLYAYDMLGGNGGGPRGHGRLRRLLRRAHRPGEDRPGGEPVATELMSAPAVTVTTATPAREAARAMYRHRIHQLPVVDSAPRLIGMVTRSDLLAVYERPDEDIRREILHDIIERTLALPPERFDVHVVGGTVTVRGDLALRSAAVRLADAITHVDGVITVLDRLTYERDDLDTTLPNL